MNYYETLTNAVHGVDGWTPIEQLHSLMTLALTTTSVAGSILEVGSWCGRSSIALGIGARETNNVKVSCVDLFPNKDDWFENEDGTYSFGVRIGENYITSYDEQTVWAEPFKNAVLPVYKENDNLMEIFKTNIKNAKLSELVECFKGELNDYLLENPNEKYRLIFLDGDHSYQHVLSEIRALEHRLSSGGWICFDDAFTVYEGVNKAITEAVINSTLFHNCHQITRKMFVAQKV